MHSTTISRPPANPYAYGVNATVRVRNPKTSSDLRVHIAKASDHIDASATTVGCARRVYRARLTSAPVNCLDCKARMRFAAMVDVTAELLREQSRAR